jgi:hypothetical protein
MNKATRQMIEAAYDRLDFLNNIRVERMRDKLHAMCEREEKCRRRGFDDGYTVSKALAAKFFIVHDLALFATNKCKLPRLAETLSLRNSYVRAAVLWANYYPEILEALGADMDALADLDYVKECCR